MAVVSVIKTVLLGGLHGRGFYALAMSCRQTRAVFVGMYVNNRRCVAQNRQLYTAQKIICTLVYGWRQSKHRIPKQTRRNETRTEKQSSLNDQPRHAPSRQSDSKHCCLSLNTSIHSAAQGEDTVEATGFLTHLISTWSCIYSLTSITLNVLFPLQSMAKRLHSSVCVYCNSLSKGCVQTGTWIKCYG